MNIFSILWRACVISLLVGTVIFCFIKERKRIYRSGYTKGLIKQTTKFKIYTIEYKDVANDLCSTFDTCNSCPIYKDAYELCKLSMLNKETYDILHTL